MSAIKSVTVTKGVPYPKDKAIIQFFESKGLYPKTTAECQFGKLEEEVDELWDALRTNSLEEILLEAGDVYITLLNVLHCKGLTIEQAVNAASEKVLKRTGKVEGGMFIKEG